MKLFILTIFLLFKSCGDSPEVRVEITPEKQTQIYAGLTTVREKARCAGYFNRLDDFKVKIVTPEGTNIDGVNYIMYQGGKVAGYYDVSADTLVLVDQPNLTAITEHEALHRIFYLNDRARFEATKDHTRPDLFQLPECK